MKTTFELSLAPWSLLYNLLTADGDIFKYVALFFGITSSPVLLTAGVISVGLGIIAGIVQSLVFPFQLLASRIQDAYSPLPTVTQSQAYPLTYSSDAGKGLEKDQIPGHFPLLFERENQFEKVSKKPLVEKDNSADGSCGYDSFGV
jgi:hypothetical protein